MMNLASTELNGLPRYENMVVEVHKETFAALVAQVQQRHTCTR